MSYDRLGVIEFGRQTIEAGDLDPLYVALNAAELNPDQEQRWLVAYWCLYHAGLSSYLSEKEGDDFWEALNLAAFNSTESPIGGKWPRGKERRHWRGKAAIASAQDLNTRFLDCGALFEHILHKPGPQGAPCNDVAAIMRRVEMLKGFGPWIAFKVADMLDALQYVDLDFSRSAIFMFDQPKQAALQVWRDHMKLPENAKPRDLGNTLIEVTDWLEDAFSDLKCPHNPDRGVRLQEVETVLCKWKSHMSGHYPIRNDIVEISEGLEPWEAVSSTAASLREEIDNL